MGKMLWCFSTPIENFKCLDSIRESMDTMIVFSQIHEKEEQDFLLAEYKRSCPCLCLWELPPVPSSNSLASYPWFLHTCLCGEFQLRGDDFWNQNTTDSTQCGIPTSLKFCPEILSSLVNKVQKYFFSLLNWYFWLNRDIVTRFFVVRFFHRTTSPGSSRHIPNREHIFSNIGGVISPMMNTPGIDKNPLGKAIFPNINHISLRS
jgi:hypothetical protein